MNEGANKNKQLPNIPVIFMQAVAGNNPSRPFLPPIHGDSKTSKV
jgi:hypothetical protein